MNKYAIITATSVKSLEIDLERLYKEGFHDLETYGESFDKYDVFDYVGDNIDNFISKQFCFIDYEISEEEIEYLMDTFEEYINALPSK